jgi:biopolymer transport protein ExbB/biopolymer transport protein TolQ
MDLWNEMGWFATGIVLVLIAMSIVSLAVAAAKWWRLRKMSRATRLFAPLFSEALESGDTRSALTLTTEHPDSHVARVLGESLREVAPLLHDRRVAGAAIDSAERAVEREQILLANEMKKGLGLEAISAGIAEALIATAIGLMVAIPAVWLYNYFTGRLETVFSEVAYAGREMIDWMLKREALREVEGAPLPTAGD